MKAQAGPPPLSVEALGPDPLVAFARWFETAQAESGLTFPNATCLSTVNAQGRPEARIVLLKGHDERGFLFFTNYRSTKARSLEARPFAALTFYWERLGRQVRVAGSVEALPAGESDAYFATRPRVSRIGAWASAQSEPLESRAALEARFREIEARYAGGDVPRPPHWGGYVVRPERIEFWQEGEGRLHDRIVYRRSDAGWETVRLNP